MTHRICIVVFCAAVFAAVASGQTQTDAAAPDTAPLRILGLQYPRLAHLAAVQGKVELEAGISDGAVNEVKTISGHPLLVDAAKESLRKWRFKQCASSAHQCSGRVIFLFVLEGGMCDLSSCPNDIQIDLPATITVKSKPARAIIN
jgi:hypothetical protein